MPDTEYSVDSGSVLIARDGACLWRGEVDGRPALRAMHLPGSADGIVVFDWMAPPQGIESWHPYPNLARIRPDGSLVWIAELPAGEPSYTQVGWTDGQLFGHGWSNIIELDPDTGAVRSVRFTK